MDDDTIPEPTAFERLLAAPERLEGLPEPVLLASGIVWTDGRLHPLDPPGLRLGDMDLLVRASARGVLPLRWSTFPSTLIKRDALERHGLPLKHFFIWSDDIEHTAQLLRDEVGYVVSDSVAEHKTATAYPPWEGGDRFYYAVHLARQRAQARGEDAADIHGPWADRALPAGQPAAAAQPSPRRARDPRRRDRPGVLTPATVDARPAATSSTRRRPLQGDDEETRPRAGDDGAGEHLGHATPDRAGPAASPWAGTQRCPRRRLG